MIPEDDWYDVAEDDSAIEPAMLTMPLYDEDGNEIPEEELPWNNMPDELSSDDDTEGWSADDEPEESLNYLYFPRLMTRRGKPSST